MDFRIIPERLPDDVKTEYLLRDMSISEVIQISREALRKVDYGTLNTYKIELWVRDEYDKQGNIDYLKHIIERGKLRYSDILKAFKLYNPFFELDPSRPIDWLDTMMRERKKEQVFLTDDFEYVPQSTKPLKITNPRWEHKDEQKSEDTPDTAAFGDTIILKADLENHIESGAVTFDVYDTSVKPPRKVGSANGLNKKKIGQAEWLVTDKFGNSADALLEFDASAKSKTTSRCKISLNTTAQDDAMITFTVTCVDLDGNPYADADFEIINVDKSRTGIKTSADGTLKITVKKKDASKVGIVHVPAIREESEETEDDQTGENQTEAELSEDEISEDDAGAMVDDSSESTTGKSTKNLSEKATAG